MACRPAIGADETKARRHTRGFEDIAESAAAPTAALVTEGSIDRFSFSKDKAGVSRALPGRRRHIGESRFDHSPAVLVEDPRLILEVPRKWRILRVCLTQRKNSSIALSRKS
jgi:hypothetical protein